MTLVSPQPRRAHIFSAGSAEHYVEPAWPSTRLFEVEDFGPASSVILKQLGGERQLVAGTAIAVAPGPGYCSDAEIGRAKNSPDPKPKPTVSDATLSALEEDSRPRMSEVMADRIPW